MGVYTVFLCNLGAVNRECIKNYSATPQNNYNITIDGYMKYQTLRVSLLEVR